MAGHVAMERAHHHHHPPIPPPPCVLTMYLICYFYVQLITVFLNIQIAIYWLVAHSPLCIVVVNSSGNIVEPMN